MQRLLTLKIILLAQTAILLAYTFLAFAQEGPVLFQTFIGNIASGTWSGQFNLDFLCYLMLSGLWIMWRQKYSAASVLIALAAMILGIVFFAPYLLLLIYKEKGDLKRVLTGAR